MSEFAWQCEVQIYEEDVETFMVNNSIIIIKTKNHLSPNLMEYKNEFKVSMN